MAGKRADLLSSGPSPLPLLQSLDLSSSRWLPPQARLSHFLEHVIDQCDRATLAVVAHTCLGGLAAATPLLYSDIIVPDLPSFKRLFCIVSGL